MVSIKSVLRGPNLVREMLSLVELAAKLFNRSPPRPARTGPTQVGTRVPAPELAAARTPRLPPGPFLPTLLSSLGPSKSRLEHLRDMLRWEASPAPQPLPRCRPRHHPRCWGRLALGDPHTPHVHHEETRRPLLPPRPAPPTPSSPLHPRW